MPNPATDRLFMWAGGKTKLMTHYGPLIPQDVHDRKFYEPFAGGAAFFNTLASRAPVAAQLSDVNREIMDLYALVRNDPQFLIARMNDFQARWMPLEVAERKKLYYEMREAYWVMPEGPGATAQLYFLIKTGFNGIWQTCQASKGRYGTPVGLANQKARVFCPDTVLAWSKKLEHAELRTCGFEDVEAEKGAFVFCDPPYRDSFTSYGTAFDDDAQIKLIEWCRAQHETRGAAVWLSNRDAADGFFEEHAPDATIHRFPVTYTAGRRKKTDTGFEAKPATEVLLTWGK